ncbi:MAG: pyrroline-5-carboxylate reductase [Corynebacteriales bacterium]|nr:pyrroline-5-carboxylate reductase [Mycobacteriales bacterium]
MDNTLAILGVGTFGEVLLAGMLSSGTKPEQLIVTGRRPERIAEITEKYSVRAGDVATAVSEAHALLLAVKPQDLGSLLDEIAPHLRPNQLVISVAAGVPTTFIEHRLGASVAVIRAMPNTPAQVDEGMTVISPGSHAGDTHLAQAEAIFASVGRVLQLPERQQDAVTALSGSGPAYFYFLVEAMIDAGILLGLPRALAADLIVQTALGSARMLRDSGEHPVQLREAVTSPGGTTINAIRELERHGVRSALIEAIEAARDRSVELGKAYGN